MIVTLTDADIQSIATFYADKGVPVAPALMERMSDEQLDMASKIMREVGAHHMAHAEELEQMPLQPEHIGPIDLCTMDVRARVLKAMDAMKAEEWTALFVAVRDELDDLGKVAERRLDEKTAKR